MRIASCLALAVVLVGCGGLTREQRMANTTEAKKRPAGFVFTDSQLATLDQDQTVVCETEKGTGSHISHRVCRTLRQSSDQAANAQRGVSQNSAGYGTVNGVVVTGP